MRHFVVPGSLAELDGPTVSGRIRLPLHLAWSSGREYDLDDPADRARVYEILLREGTLDDLRTFVDPLCLTDALQRTVLAEGRRRFSPTGSRRPGISSRRDDIVDGASGSELSENGTHSDTRVRDAGHPLHPYRVAGEPFEAHRAKVRHGATHAPDAAHRMHELLQNRLGPEGTQKGVLGLHPAS